MIEWKYIISYHIQIISIPHFCILLHSLHVRHLTTHPKNKEPVRSSGNESAIHDMGQIASVDSSARSMTESTAMWPSVNSLAQKCPESLQLQDEYIHTHKLQAVNITLHDYLYRGGRRHEVTNSASKSQTTKVTRDAELEVPPLPPRGCSID